MNNKRWIKIWFIFSLIIPILASVNYIVNPFNIFNSNILKYQYQINERYSKVEFLKENHHKYNSYIFGSSRVGNTHPEVIEQYIPNSKFYNFTIAGANIYDYYLHLKYIISNGYKIKNLYLSIDVDNMHLYGVPNSNYLAKLHPSVTNNSAILFYGEYLFGYFPLNIRGKIKQNFIKKDLTKYYLKSSGIWSKSNLEEVIKKDCKSYVSSKPSLNMSNTRRLDFKYRDEILSSLNGIKNLCKENNIKLYSFITPHNKNMMDSFIIKDYLEFLKTISNNINFYNFSAYNSITTNNCNYIESSHYVSNISSLIAAKIFNDINISTPSDFGQFVTKDNINEHLDKIKENIQNYDLSKEKQTNAI